jgi:hypothetical protein
MVSEELFAEQFTGLFILDDNFPRSIKNVGKCAIGLLFKDSSALVRFQSPDDQPGEN